MKTIAWFVACPVFVVLGIVSIFHSFNGTAGFNFGYPMDQNAFSVSGKATGAFVLVGVALELAAVLTFVAGVVRSLRPKASQGEQLASGAAQGK